MLPETKYAKSGDVHIAYQTIGRGRIDLLHVSPWVFPIEVLWEEPSVARFFQRLASFSRLILFDKRGTGLSDRVIDADLPTLEQRMDDVRAVMDAVGSEQAALYGASEGGPMSALFAATYPERTAALIMWGSFAKWVWSSDYPWAKTLEERQSWVEAMIKGWGTPESVDLSQRAPSVGQDEGYKRWWARLQRVGASPGAMRALARMNRDIDIRHALGTIRVPTLLLHRTGDQTVEIDHSRYMVAHIPGAKLVELAGSDHHPWLGEAESVLTAVEEFLTGMRRSPEPDRVLATVMFTDIVGSTERAAMLGDRRWHDLRDRHHALIRRELTRFHGREVETAGDSFLATFDGPARAIRCACAVSDAVKELGIEIRAGLHTGECELMDEKMGGIAVHIGARVATMAGPSEVLVSGTVKDLVAGSGIQFSDRGTHTLKGVPGEWRTFAVERS
jgi:class 3 adenylate cyclase